MLLLFYMNVSGMRRGPALDDTGSLGFPTRRVVYRPGSMVPPWVTAFHSLAGNTEAEVKPTPFSSLLLFLLISPPKLES